MAGGKYTFCYLFYDTRWKICENSPGNFVKSRKMQTGAEARLYKNKKTYFDTCQLLMYSGCFVDCGMYAMYFGTEFHGRYFSNSNEFRMPCSMIDFS